jgi:hypothetical protein
MSFEFKLLLTIAVLTFLMIFANFFYHFIGLYGLKILWHRYSPLNQYRLQKIKKQIEKNDLSTHKLVLVYQSNKTRPHGVMGGFYYPENGILDITNGIEELPRDVRHFKVHQFTNEEMYDTNLNEYWFSVNAPYKDHLTREEVLTAMTPLKK